jgi:agmatinase
MQQIIKVPGINGLGHTSKTRNAGNAILRELDAKLLDIEEIHVNNSKLDEQEKLIYENSLKALESKDKVIFLGGDHSISYSIGKAFLEFYREGESFIIVFDAHADCMKPMREPTHEEWLRALVEAGWNPRSIVLVGLRRIENEELEFLAKNKIRYYQMRDIESKEDVCDSIMESTNGQPVYVSIDIDVIDPAFAPGTGYPESGGFSSSEMLYFARRIAKMKNLRAIDIVEVQEQDNPTVKLASSILREFI